MHSHPDRAELLMSLFSPPNGLVLQSLCFKIHCLYARLGVGSDERQNAANAGVYTGLASGRATLAPRYDTDELVAGVHEGATAVTLAGVLAARCNTSADHFVGNGRLAVVGAASAARNDRHRHLPELSRCCGGSG